MATAKLLTGTHPGHTPDDRRTHIELRDEPQAPAKDQAPADEPSGDEWGLPWNDDQEPPADDAEPTPDPAQGPPQE